MIFLTNGGEKVMSLSFFERLTELQKQKKSCLCVGIDPNQDKLPEIFADTFVLWDWCKKLVDDTIDHTAVYKPNYAFFSAGFSEVLKKLILYIHEKGALVILDAKRGDIGKTAKKYAVEAFEYYNADAVTYSPYMGGDTVQPFLEEKYKDKGVILLCRTSNPGGADFQNLVLKNGERLYENVAKKALEWDQAAGSGRIALVVGATVPEELAKVREIIGDNMALLIPGIGAQGGDVEKTVKAGQNSKGLGMMINSSSAIAEADDQEQAAINTNKEINQYRIVA